MTERENELLRADLEVCAADRDQMKAERDSLKARLALALKIARAGFPHSHPECPVCRGEGTGPAIQTEEGAVFYSACAACDGRGFIELEKLS